MITRVLSIAVLALAGALAAGCASLPPKSNATDSLVLIKTNVIDYQNAPKTVQYRFILGSGYPPAEVGAISQKYVAIVVHEPGVKVSEIVGRLPDNYDGPGWTYERRSSYKVDLTLPYEPGKAVVADFVFTRNIFYDTGDESRFYTVVGLRTIKPEEKQQLLAMATQDKAGSTWREAAPAAP
jgi:hypothetical protein